MDSLETSLPELATETTTPVTESAATGRTGAKPGARVTRTPSEVKAEETTRVAREPTNAATEVRRTKTAQLR